MSVRALAYAGFEVSDRARWATFATDILGLACATAPNGALWLRMDEHPYRLIVESGPRDDLTVLGWEVGTVADLGALVARLRSAGLVVHDDDAATARRRGVAALAWCEDPSSLRNEFVVPAEPAAITPPFISPRGLSGFVTGAGGLGHVVLAVDDAVAATRFYHELLGMRVSDYISFEREPGQRMDMTFLHCNERHHSVAIVKRPGAPKLLSHLMIEARSLDDVGLTYSLCERENVPIAMTLGRHTNDLMYSFYLVTPSGFNLEFGYGGRSVDDATWQIAHYDAASIWGHRRAAVAAPPVRA